jgi:hypothetical protein
MNKNEHLRIRHLRHRWNEEDAAREELEAQARRKFLEQEANRNIRTDRVNEVGGSPSRRRRIGNDRTRVGTPW